MKRFWNSLVLLFLNIGSKKPVERISMHRYGRLDTSLVSANQCKAVGHAYYDYVIRINCLNHLDKNGFLIDNRAINQVLQEGLTKMDSCERLCIHFANLLESTFKEKGVSVCDMRVELKPIMPGVDYKDLAEFEFFRDYEHKSTKSL